MVAIDFECSEARKTDMEPHLVDFEESSTELRYLSKETAPQKMMYVSQKQRKEKHDHIGLRP